MSHYKMCHKPALPSMDIWVASSLAVTDATGRAGCVSFNAREYICKINSQTWGCRVEGGVVGFDPPACGPRAGAGRGAAWGAAHRAGPAEARTRIARAELAPAAAPARCCARRPSTPRPPLPAPADSRPRAPPSRSRSWRRAKVPCLSARLRGIGPPASPGRSALRSPECSPLAAGSGPGGLLT